MTLYSREAELFEQVLPLFNAMGDKTRQQLICHLGPGVQISVGELTHLTKLSRPAVSHHIKVLRDAGIVTEVKRGRKRFYQPTFLKYIAPMRELLDCVEKIEKDVRRREQEKARG